MNQYFNAIRGGVVVPFMVFCLGLTSCTSNSSTITEQDVKDLFNAYFYELSVDSEGRDGLYELVTEDYYIFENEKKYTLPEFLDWLDTLPDIVDDNWTFSEFDISIDRNSAHATLKNNGRFIVNIEDGQQQLDYVWLESAYFIKEGDKLKFKFYFSDTIDLTVTNL